MKWYKALSDFNKACFLLCFSMLLVLCQLPSLRERLRSHKVFTKDQYFYINYHKFSIKSYVLDVY